MFYYKGLIFSVFLDKARVTISGFAKVHITESLAGNKPVILINVNIIHRGSSVIRIRKVPVLKWEKEGLV